MKTIFLFLGCIFILLIAHGQKFAVTLGENVNIRTGASLNAGKTGKIESDLTLLEVVYVSFDKEKIKISNVDIEDYWVEIKTKDGTDGFIFGYFLQLFDSKADAEYFVAKNKEFRSQVANNYQFIPQTEDIVGDNYYTVELFENGRLKMSANKVEGDHSMEGEGEGRYFIHPVKGIILFQAVIKYNFAPDGYTWAEYFELAKGHKPSKTELEQYIKEMSVYYQLEKFEEKIEHQNKILKPLAK